MPSVQFATYRSPHLMSLLPDQGALNTTPRPTFSKTLPSSVRDAPADADSERPTVVEPALWPNTLLRTMMDAPYESRAAPSTLPRKEHPSMVRSSALL